MTAIGAPDLAHYTPTLLVVLDLLGTVVFALSGASAAVEHRLDLFGVLVLAYVTAVGGGIVRDLVIGVVPPAAFRDWRYPALAVLAGLAVFAWPHLTERFARPVLFFDAVGLSLFAVSGAQKALDAGLGGLMAVLLGTVTAVGGGVARDVLVREIPVVLRADVYAVAALAGAAIVVVGHAAHAPAAPMAAAGAAACFVLRMVSWRRGWQFPVARSRR